MASIVETHDWPCCCNPPCDTYQQCPGYTDWEWNGTYWIIVTTTCLCPTRSRNDGCVPLYPGMGSFQYPAPDAGSDLFNYVLPGAFVGARIRTQCCFDPQCTPNENSGVGIYQWISGGWQLIYSCCAEGYTLTAPSWTGREFEYGSGTAGEIRVVCCSSTGYFCGTSACPDTAMVEISGATDEGGCTNCTSYNDTFDCPLDVAVSAGGPCTGEVTRFDGVSCVPAPYGYMTIFWSISCNLFDGDLPHYLEVQIRDEAFVPRIIWYGQYRFADGDTLSGVTLTPAPTMTSSIPCIQPGDASTYKCVIKFTAVFP